MDRFVPRRVKQARAAADRFSQLALSGDMREQAVHPSLHLRGAIRLAPLQQGVQSELADLKATGLGGLAAEVTPVPLGEWLGTAHRARPTGLTAKLKVLPNSSRRRGPAQWTQAL